MHAMLASHFLAGAILTWGMPIGLLVLIGLYWLVLLRRRSPGTRTGRVE